MLIRQFHDTLGEIVFDMLKKKIKRKDYIALLNDIKQDN